MQGLHPQPCPSGTATTVLRILLFLSLKGGDKDLTFVHYEDSLLPTAHIETVLLPPTHIIIQPSPLKHHE